MFFLLLMFCVGRKAERMLERNKTSYLMLQVWCSECGYLQIWMKIGK